MDNSEIRKEIQEEVRKAEKILVGIGAEWKRGDEDREEQIRRASKALRELLEGKDAFIISTLTLGEMEDRGFEKEHLDDPFGRIFNGGAMEWLYRLAGRDFKQDYGAPGAGRGLCPSVPDPVAL